MAGVTADIGATAGRAIFTRIFGWLVLGTMTAYLVDVILTFWFGMPGVGPLLGFQGNGAPGPLMWLQAAICLAIPAAFCLNVLRTPDRALRQDAQAISDFNAFLIRAAFFVVLMVGLADTVVSFLRVEGFLPYLVGDDMTLSLGKSQFRGHWVHVPAALIGIALAFATRTLGFIWLALLVVMAELLIVFSRFLLSYEQAFMADLVRFWYAALFLFGSAFTLKEDGHVRVDVFYTNFSRRAQGRVNAVGSVMLGMTLCWAILLVGMWTSSSIIVGPPLVFETTQTGFGMYVKYFMAGYLGVFAVTMMIQFVSYLFESVADMRGEPGGHAEHHVSHIS